nr:expressed protein [Hymenolepis microstoma]
MIIQGQSQHRIDDQHQRRSSKVMSQPHDLPTMRSACLRVYIMTKSPQPHTHNHRDPLHTPPSSYGE